MTAPTPLDYAAWRATRLGRITEALERNAILELAGSVGGLDVPTSAAATAPTPPRSPGAAPASPGSTPR